MGSLMESKLTARQHALVGTVLKAQTASLGRVEIPVVADLLKKSGARSALDIGCGEGAFLLRLAREARGVRFLGLDHNEMAIRDARRSLRRLALPNVELKAAFFDPAFEAVRYDAVLTRYTLQHGSDPRAFVEAVFKRLKRKGVYIAVESLDDYSDCHRPVPVWERFLAALAAIHRKIGSHEDIGKSLGGMFRQAGFRDVRVRVMLCAPSTIGWAPFCAVVRAQADLAHFLFPDLFERRLVNKLAAWLDDRAGLEAQDPYLCSAIANGTRP
ncbi:MAG: methyltransferase domain-containing protein [Candidatus Aminicenantes bacterium]|nr:methyltransferase domain-containing protein [Candidatus Aminicenantes bacterium]